MLLKSDIRGAEYRLKARQALDAADVAGLAQVRLRHEAAANVWYGLAAFEDRRGVIARAAIARASVAEARSNAGADLCAR